MQIGFQKNSQSTFSQKKIELKEKFKMEVPKNVFDQMMYLCSQVPTLEWSGVMFYKTSGNINNLSTFKVIAQDIFLKDIGSGAFTSYETGEDEVEFMMENPKYCEYEMGKIHSHNNMAVFHSGTDWEDLWDNSLTHNYYLSFIVNNRGHVEVKIAWRSESNESHYFIKDKNGRLVKRISPEGSSVLVTADGEITVKGSNQPAKWFVDRFNKVQQEKQATAVNKNWYEKDDDVITTLGRKVDTNRTSFTKYNYLEKRWENELDNREESAAPEKLPFSNVTGKTHTDSNFLANLMTMGATTSLDDAFTKVDAYTKGQMSEWIPNVFNDKYWDNTIEKMLGKQTIESSLKVCKNLLAIIFPYKNWCPDVYSEVKDLLEFRIDSLEKEQEINEHYN